MGSASLRGHSVQFGAKCWRVGAWEGVGGHVGSGFDDLLRLSDKGT